jgi:hypothetical protein
MIRPKLRIADAGHRSAMEPDPHEQAQQKPL